MIRQDLINKVYTMLTVIEEAENGRRGVRWKCRCECGNEVIVYAADLRTKHQLSCGCLKWKGTPTHGLSDSAIRQCYYNMRKRCYSPNFKSYKDYGGRGITICEEWSTFQGFLDDMLPTHKPGLSIERKDVNGNYCKDNCCWESKKIQANNTRSNHYVEYLGEKYTLATLANKYDIDPRLLRLRLMRGWTIDQAVSPVEELESITYNNVTKTVAKFAKEYGMAYHQLKKRLMRDWTIERALTQPLRRSQK